MASEYDVVVAGGGPAGATAAGLLAKRGRRVLVLERDKFPRYHIGESLTTGILPALNELGFTPKASARFLHKYGGTLLWGSDDEPWDFRFADAQQWEYSFQVDRAEFDHLLLQHVRGLGVDVIEEATVRRVLYEGERAVGVEYRKGAEDVVVDAEFVIDASGQGKVLGRQLQLVEWHDDLRNVACWDYYEGVNFYDGTRAGDTITESRPDGWLWFIPLIGDRASVGFVTPTALLKERKFDLPSKLREEIADSLEVSKLVGQAQPAGRPRTARDWSYNCHRMAGPGWALVGDAAAFVDPLMSAGVAVSLRASKGLAAAVDWSMDHPSTESAVLDQYSKDYGRMIDDLLDFIRYFYDRTRDRDDYRTKAQSLVGVGMDERRAFATILSSMAGLHEVFADPEEAASAQVTDAVWH